MGSYLDTFRLLDQQNSFESVGASYGEPQSPQMEWSGQQQDPSTWLDRYQAFLSKPKFTPNIDGFITPYVGGNWGGTSGIMETLTDQFQMGQEKIDPNRIFSSDIASLKTLAADQAKVVKVFERKFLESLTDRGKFGLNEDDIAAMQALTSARSAIASINKEQAAIKKNITELKIKQQQNAAATSGAGPGANPGRSASAFDVGRSIMDQIFDMPTSAQEPVVTNSYPSMGLDEASNVLESLVNVSDVPNVVQYESDNPTTYVVVGDRDDDIEFATYSASGELLPDYPNPTTKIQSIDRDAGKAIDELLVQYPIKHKE